MKAIKKKYFLFVLGIFANLQFVITQELSIEIESYISKLVDSTKFSGSVLVADGNGIILKKGYGQANIEGKEPNRSDTKFRIGSLTKQFTSMLIMQFVEDGELSLDDSIKDKLSSLELENDATIRELLTHTSGIKDYTEIEYSCGSVKNPKIDPWEFAKCFNTLENEFEPGTAHSYSNTNYYLLGLLIEKITKKTFDEALRDGILNPLQMQNTGYHKKDSSNFAQGYTIKTGQLTKTKIEDIDLAYAAGGMYSTVEDLHKWDQALRKQKLLDKESLKMSFAQNRNVEPDYYGFGWFVDEEHYEYKDHRTFHEGGINGFSACIDRYLNNGICIIVLSNFEFTEARVDLTEPITKMVYESNK